MNKNQIEKHGSVIEWFLSNPDKGIMYKDMNGKKNWNYTDNPAFRLEAYYVENDEYVDLRMAQVDGGIIQVLGPNCWEDDNSGLFNLGTPTDYRIKPNYKYPIYMTAKATGDVVKFTSLTTGILVYTSDNSPGEVGVPWTWTTHENTCIWEEYKPKMYELKDIPQDVCFSNNGFGSFYKELEGNFHCYDRDGNYDLSGVTPSKGKYYLSNRDGSYRFDNAKMDDKYPKYFVSCSDSRKMLVEFTDITTGTLLAKSNRNKLAIREERRDWVEHTNELSWKEIPNIDIVNEIIEKVDSYNNEILKANSKIESILRSTC